MKNILFVLRIETELFQIVLSVEECDDKITLVCGLLPFHKNIISGEDARADHAFSFGNQGKIISLFHQRFRHTNRLNEALLFLLSRPTSNSTQNRNAMNGRDFAHLFCTRAAITVVTQLTFFLHIHEIAMNSGKRNAGTLDDLAHAGDFIMLVVKCVDEIRDDRFLRFVFPSHNGLQRHRVFLIEGIIFETLCVNIFL